MDTYSLNINPPLNSVNVNIEYKNIKNVHLKVFRDCSVKLSVPLNVPDNWIVSLLEKKKDWINKQLLKYKETSGFNTLEYIKSGTSTQILGKDMRIYKVSDNRNFITEEEKSITVHLIDIEDEDKLNSIVRKWWRKKALAVYKNEMMLLYDKIFKKHNISIPDLYIRKMKTLWGSCTPEKGKITLNEYLLKADIRCIQYVVFHELTHLIYPYHNQDFYNFLTIYMPDWKVRKRELDKEVVQTI